VVMAAAAGADALHAAGRSLPHQAAAITAAVLPFVLVLVAFALLVVMLRHARLRRAASSDDRRAVHRSAGAQGQPAEGQALAGQHEWTTVPSHVVVQPVRPASLQLGRAVVSTSKDDVGEPETEPAQPELAMDADPAAGDPSTDEADEADVAGADETVGEPADGSMPYPAESLAPGGDGDAIDTETADPDEIGDPDETAGPEDPDMPVFHRLFSSPTPPTE
jgi:hypothetical protein